MFKLYKASGARVPDIVSHLGAGSTLGGTPANVVNGLALQISSGTLEAGATNVAVAGICVASYNGGGVGSLYAGPNGSSISATFPEGIEAGTEIPFLPVTGTVPVEADVKASTILIANGLPGATLDIDTGGLQLTTSVNGDFRIVKVLEDDGTYVTKVVGFFTNPGYFTA